MRTKAEELTIALEIARMKRTLKRLPHISKRGNITLTDLFPTKKAPAIASGRAEERESATNEANTVRIP